MTSALTGKGLELPTNPLPKVNNIFSQILIYRVSVLFNFIGDDLMQTLAIVFERSGNNYSLGD